MRDMRNWQVGLGKFRVKKRPILCYFLPFLCYHLHSAASAVLKLFQQKFCKFCKIFLKITKNSINSANSVFRGILQHPILCYFLGGKFSFSCFKNCKFPPKKWHSVLSVFSTKWSMFCTMRTSQNLNSAFFCSPAMFLLSTFSWQPASAPVIQLAASQQHLSSSCQSVTSTRYPANR